MYIFGIYGLEMWIEEGIYIYLEEKKINKGEKIGVAMATGYF